MSSVGQNAIHLQQEIQHELITAHHLLKQISSDLQLIKNFTMPGGELDSTIQQNISLMAELGPVYQINVENTSDNHNNMSIQGHHNKT